MTRATSSAGDDGDPVERGAGPWFGQGRLLRNVGMRLVPTFSRSHCLCPVGLDMGRLRPVARRWCRRSTAPGCAASWAREAARDPAPRCRSVVATVQAQPVADVDPCTPATLRTSAAIAITDPAGVDCGRDRTDSAGVDCDPFTDSAGVDCGPMTDSPPGSRSAHRVGGRAMAGSVQVGAARAACSCQRGAAPAAAAPIPGSGTRRSAWSPPSVTVAVPADAAALEPFLATLRPVGSWLITASQATAPIAHPGRAGGSAVPAFDAPFPALTFDPYPAAGGRSASVAWFAAVSGGIAAGSARRRPGPRRRTAAHRRAARRRRCPGARATAPTRLGR